MNSFVPLAVFEHDAQAVLAVDEDGRIRFCNRAAADLLKCGRESAIGRTCWSVARLLRGNGTPFCSPACPVQRQACRGHVEPCHRVALASNGRGMRNVELVTFLVPVARGGRSALLHLLRPMPRAADARNNSMTRSIATGSLLLDRLSRREMQVLRLLASGLDTKAIAAHLSIRPVTVGNHIAHLLRKLGFHRRMDAVLALYGGRHR